MQVKIGKKTKRRPAKPAEDAQINQLTRGKKCKTQRKVVGEGRAKQGQGYKKGKQVREQGQKKEGGMGSPRGWSQFSYCIFCIQFKYLYV